MPAASVLQMAADEEEPDNRPKLEVSFRFLEVLLNSVHGSGCIRKVFFVTITF